MYYVFPLGHLAVGYLCYVGYCRYSGRPATLPALKILFILAVATQLPDLVDKPLAHVGILASGRSLGHSLLFLLPLSATVWWFSVSREMQHISIVGTLGVLSHLGADSYRAILSGDWAALRYLLYPLISPVTYPNDGVSPALRIYRHYTTPQFTVETAVILLGLGIAVWQFATTPEPAG